MFGALFEIMIGIATSIIIGGTVYIFHKLKKLKRFNIESNFFMINPDIQCYFVMNHAYQTNRINHNDVYALFELSKIIQELKGELEIFPVTGVQIAPGDNTEFCIGGPDSNIRSKEHIETYLTGINVKTYSEDSPTIEIKVKDKIFKYNQYKKEYVILSKIMPLNKEFPIFLISGQSSITNRGAAYYLVNNYSQIIKKYGTTEQFCYILCINNSKLYGYKTIELVEDITESAFSLVN